MKKYTGMIISGLIGGAIVAAIFFAIVLSGEKEGDVSNKPIVDEPAGTKQSETPECQSDNDCETGLECFRGKCSYPCGGAPMCPVGMICNDTSGYCVRDLDGKRRQLACMQGIEICNGLDDDCDGEADEGCNGPGRFDHCWTLPEVSPRVAFEGEIGYRYTSPSGERTASLLVATAPWQTLAEAANTNSACFSLVLDPGWSTEYQMVSESISPFWGCVGSYPPGTLNGEHKVTLDGVPINPVLINDRTGGCKFRFHRPMP